MMEASAAESSEAISDVNKHDLTHARHDPSHCLAPGLFRSLKKGERKTGKLDVTYEYGEDECMRFVGFEPLGADDLRMLQVIVALAGPDSLVLSPEPQTATGRQLRVSLEPKFDALKQDALVVRESLTKLLWEAGMTDSGDNILSLKASLLRMSNVTVLAKKGQRQASYHLMSHALDEESGKIWIALNPRLAESILGKRQFARIDMNEVRALQSGPSRLMHQRLCGWINPGKFGRVGLDTLCEYVWPDQTSNTNTLKTRRQTARKALAELAAVGWTMSEYAKGKWEIKRPARPS